MKLYFAARKLRKQADELCRHARHFLNMREDLLPAADCESLRQAEIDLRAAMRARSDDLLPGLMENLGGRIEKLSPPHTHNAWRENLEVIVVAFAIAMCFRTYFIQPFKIPTGSMQPTLNGIRYAPANRAAGDVDWTMRGPFKVLRWAILGDWYSEVRVAESGMTNFGMDGITVNKRLYQIGREMVRFVVHHQMVAEGQLLASGIKLSGDHLFVNKVAWNFRRPQRGEVMVFTTDTIPELDDKKTHYIKRMVGLPGETISISPPNIVINGSPLTGPASITKIANSVGYRLSNRRGDPLSTLESVVHLTDRQYFACGDNSPNSLDSRFWGPVPADNLVGPACFVYWPFGGHWGLIHND